MRSRPIGCDKDALNYWFYMDAEFAVRVYTQSPGDTNAQTWTLVASELDQLKKLIASLSAEPLLAKLRSSKRYMAKQQQQQQQQQQQETTESKVEKKEASKAPEPEPVIEAVKEESKPVNIPKVEFAVVEENEAPKAEQIFEENIPKAELVEANHLKDETPTKSVSVKIKEECTPCLIYIRRLVSVY